MSNQSTACELCWLIEQTSSEDGVTRFWDGRGFYLDATKAARYFRKDSAEVELDRINEGRGPAHGKARLCEHIFGCGTEPEESIPSETRDSADAARYRRIRFKAWLDSCVDDLVVNTPQAIESEFNAGYDAMIETEYPDPEDRNGT